MDSESLRLSTNLVNADLDMDLVWPPHNDMQYSTPSGVGNNNHFGLISSATDVFSPHRNLESSIVLNQISAPTPTLKQEPFDSSSVSTPSTQINNTTTSSSNPPTTPNSVLGKRKGRIDLMSSSEYEPESSNEANSNANTNNNNNNNGSTTFTRPSKRSKRGRKGAANSNANTPNASSATTPLHPAELGHIRVCGSNISLRSQVLIQFDFKNKMQVSSLKRRESNRNGNDVNLVIFDLHSEQSTSPLGELKISLHEDCGTPESRPVEFCPQCASKSKSGKVLDVRDSNYSKQQDGFFDVPLVLNEQSSHSNAYRGGAGKVYYSLRFTIDWIQQQQPQQQTQLPTLFYKSHYFKVVAPGKGVKKEHIMSAPRPSTNRLDSETIARIVSDVVSIKPEPVEQQQQPQQSLSGEQTQPQQTNPQQTQTTTNTSNSVATNGNTTQPPNPQPQPQPQQQPQQQHTQTVPTMIGMIARVNNNNNNNHTNNNNNTNPLQASQLVQPAKGYMLTGSELLTWLVQKVSIQDQTIRELQNQLFALQTQMNAQHQQLSSHHHQLQQQAQTIQQQQAQQTPQPSFSSAAMLRSSHALTSV